jgi:hypothetical protein
MVSRKLLISAASMVVVGLGTLGIMGSAQASTPRAPRPSAASADAHQLSAAIAHLTRTMHGHTAPGAGSLVASNFDLEGCFYTVRDAGISLKNAPNGNDVWLTSDGDNVISAPRTVDSSGAWEFVFDLDGGASGWIGKGFMNFDFCTSPSSEP